MRIQFFKLNEGTNIKSLISFCHQAASAGSQFYIMVLDN